MQSAMHTARLPATGMFVQWSRLPCLVLSCLGVGLGVGSNKTDRVLYCHDSDAGIPHYSIMQAGRSPVTRYSTRGENMPLSSALVRLNVSLFVISFTCRSCFILTVTP